MFQNFLGQVLQTFWRHGKDHLLPDLYHLHRWQQWKASGIHQGLCFLHLSQDLPQDLLETWPNLSYPVGRIIWTHQSDSRLQGCAVCCEGQKDGDTTSDRHGPRAGGQEHLPVIQQICSNLVFTLHSNMSWHQKMKPWFLGIPLAAKVQASRTRVHRFDGSPAKFKWISSATPSNS